MAGPRAARCTTSRCRSTTCRRAGSSTPGTPIGTWRCRIRTKRRPPKRQSPGTRTTGIPSTSSATASSRRGQDRKDRLDARREGQRHVVAFQRPLRVAAWRDPEQGRPADGLRRQLLRDPGRRHVRFTRRPCQGPGPAGRPEEAHVALVRQYLHAVPARSTCTAHTSTWPSPAACNCSPTATFWSAGDPHPYFSEYTEAGKMLLDAVFLGKDLSYRALYTDNGWAGPT